MKYSAERIYVRFWNVEDASLLLDLQVRNRAEIERISASNRDESFYSLEGKGHSLRAGTRREKKEIAILLVFFYIQRMNLSVRFPCSRSYWILPQNGSLVM